MGKLLKDIDLDALKVEVEALRCWLRIEVIRKQVKRLREDISPEERSPPLRVSFHIDCVYVLKDESPEEAKERVREAGETYLDENGVERWVIGG